MPELGPSGSVRGAPSNGRPYAIRRASSEKVNVQADPTATSGKADTAG
jgi:hypothetical protein